MTRYRGIYIHIISPHGAPLLSHCRSPLASWAKLCYYRLFSALYGACGRCSDVTMVNSSWTEGHIAALWGRGDAIQKVGSSQTYFYISLFSL